MANKLLTNDPISYCINNYKYGRHLVELLLEDKTAQRNIFWGTDKKKTSLIKLDEIFNNNESAIKPRVFKSKAEQQYRIKKKGEVFTPTWICNLQNNATDEDFFSSDNVFNTVASDGKSWLPNTNKIQFSDGKTWQSYIKQGCLEITCGEAPYLVSPYDTTTGEYIKLEKRVGLLDRKLRIVSENTTSEEEWIKWAIIAYKHSYAYEWQGDSLLIARVNLFLTFVKNFEKQFNKQPEEKVLFELANIIAWNIIQMDGLTLTIPYSCSEDCKGCKKKDINLHNGVYAKTYDWTENKPIFWLNILD